MDHFNATPGLRPNSDPTTTLAIISSTNEVRGKLIECIHSPPSLPLYLQWPEERRHRLYPAGGVWQGGAAISAGPSPGRDSADSGRPVPVHPE